MWLTSTLASLGNVSGLTLIISKEPNCVLESCSWEKGGEGGLKIRLPSRKSCQRNLFRKDHNQNGEMYENETMAKLLFVKMPNDKVISRIRPGQHFMKTRCPRAFQGLSTTQTLYQCGVGWSLTGDGQRKSS